MRALELLGGLFVAGAIGIGFFRLAALMVRGAMKSTTNDEENKNG